MGAYQPENAASSGPARNLAEEAPQNNTHNSESATATTTAAADAHLDFTIKSKSLWAPVGRHRRIQSLVFSADASPDGESDQRLELWKTYQKLIVERTEALRSRGAPRRPEDIALTGGNETFKATRWTNLTIRFLMRMEKEVEKAGLDVRRGEGRAEDVVKGKQNSDEVFDGGVAVKSEAQVKVQDPFRPRKITAAPQTRARAWAKGKGVPGSHTDKDGQKRDVKKPSTGTPTTVSAPQKPSSSSFPLNQAPQRKKRALTRLSPARRGGINRARRRGELAVKPWPRPRLRRFLVGDLVRKFGVGVGQERVESPGDEAADQPAPGAEIGRSVRGRRRQPAALRESLAGGRDRGGPVRTWRSLRELRRTATLGEAAPASGAAIVHSKMRRPRLRYVQRTVLRVKRVRLAGSEKRDQRERARMEKVARGERKALRLGEWEERKGAWDEFVGGEEEDGPVESAGREVKRDALGIVEEDPKRVGAGMERRLLRGVRGLVRGR